MSVRIKKFILRLILNLFKIRAKFLFDTDKQLPNKILFISNNVSFLDSIVIYAFLPTNPILALNGYIIRKKWVKFCLKLFGADFFEFNPLDPVSVKHTISLLDSGRNVFLFPEGRMTKNGALMKIYEAPAIIADRTKAQIIPVWINGLQFSYFSILKGKNPLRWFPKTEVVVSYPIELQLDDQYRKQRDYLSNVIHKILLELSFRVQYKENDSIFNMAMRASKVYGKKNFFTRPKIVEDAKREPKSYKEILVKSFLFGNYFKKQFKLQESVGVMLPNSCECLYIFFALTAYERIPAMINFSSGIFNILSCCKTAVIKNIITSKNFIQAGKYEELIEKLEKENIKIYYIEDLEKSFGIFDRIKAISQYKIKRVPFANSGDKTCVILFTSGSEGSPKGVLLSHNNIVSNIIQTECVVGLNKSDLLFNVLPMFHSFGLTVATLTPFMYGSKVFLYPSPLHHRIIPELIYEIGATTMFATDTFLKNYSRVAHPYDFNSMRFVLGGAESVKTDNRYTWSERFGVRLLEGYGTTECSPVITLNNSVFCKFGTVGQFLPAIEYRLKKVEGVDDGGILQVRGPNVMKGYFLSSNPGVLKPLDADGWYDTGDVVDVDSTGYLIIKDRVKRFAKIAGEMISLTSVEEIAKNMRNGKKYVDNARRLWAKQEMERLRVIDEKKQMDVVADDVISAMGDSVPFVEFS